MAIEDSGWWKGELRGKTGVFPDNFVELIPPEEVKPPPKKPPPPKNLKSEAPEKPVTNNIRPNTPPTSDKKAEVDTKPNPGLQSILERKHELRSSQTHAPPDRLKKKDPIPELPSPGDKSHIPAKKPALPPPVHRKPNQILRELSKESKPEPKIPEIKTEIKQDVKTVKVTVEDSAELRTSTDSSVNLDVVESSEKLSHPTASRAKFPNRRPPSTVLTLNSNHDDEKGKDEKPEPASAAMTSSVEVQKDEPVKEVNKKLTTSATSPWSSTAGVASGGVKRPPPPSIMSTSMTNKNDTIDSAGAAMSNTNQSAIDDLRKELQTLKANTVSKTAFNELKTENDRLRKDFTALKTAQQKRSVELMKEIDEEKKGRLNMQVEIERIKKMLQDSDA